MTAGASPSTRGTTWRCSANRPQPRTARWCAFSNQAGRQRNWRSRTSATPPRVSCRWRTPNPLCASWVAEDMCSPTTATCRASTEARRWRSIATVRSDKPIRSMPSARCCRDLSPLWHAQSPPTLDARLSVLSEFAHELRALGPANFLYADGDALFAHGHRRMQITGRAEPPGLWTRQRLCPTADAAPEHSGGASISQAAQTVVWLASVPLTQDAWQPLAEGELVAVRAGALLARRLATAA